ncbi:hypothetical protein L6452_31288 [Arctium lappa]|uniref:Uncharacterized protein n=1 Tax=Arctium lappa TaxID=4217 RepID=A0ACB8ZL03_ARCLA|nr:hypothetical protein L6452_31288 [Arctium lappa]
MFLKLLEDRDTNYRRHETVDENIIVEGSGGTGPGIPIDAITTPGVGQATKTCTFKAFLGCRPPEFKGSDDPTMLRGATLTWWNVYPASIEATVLAKLTWATFKEKLLEEYCNEMSMD